MDRGWELRAVIPPLCPSDAHLKIFFQGFFTVGTALSVVLPGGCRPRGGFGEEGGLPARDGRRTTRSGAMLRMRVVVRKRGQFWRYVAEEVGH